MFNIYLLKCNLIIKIVLEASRSLCQLTFCQGTFIARGPLIDSRAHYIKSVCTVGK